MSISTISKGKTGERIACELLRSKGFSVCRRNERIARDEIDIIAFDHNEKCLVFTEVKYRSRFVEGFSAESMLTPSKRKKLLRSARAWVAANAYEGAYRIDAVLIDDATTSHIIGLRCEDY